MRKEENRKGALEAGARQWWNLKMAEREGFEPTVRFRYSRFPGARLKPLSHLSTDYEFESLRS